LWRVSDGRRLRIFEGHTNSVLTVAFSPDGSLVASGAGGVDRDDYTVRLWRVSDGVQVRILWGHTWDVNSVAFAPDGRVLVSGGRDATVRLWRISDGAPLRIYNRETIEGVWSVQFSPNGRLFSYGREDATVVVARNPFWRRGDANGDGCVDDADLLLVLWAFGCSEGCGVEELTDDSRVDNADLLEVLLNFGSGC
jgi:WD40 repeat protein